MKKIFTAILCIAMIALTATSVMAAAGKGNYGEAPMFIDGIDVDGVIDEAYTEFGLEIEIAGDFPGNYASDSTGTAYMLHDGENVYVIMEIANSHEFKDPGKEITADAYKETGIEFYFDWKGDGSTMYKWMLWPNGLWIASSNNTAPDTIVEYAAVNDGKNYTIELCVTPDGGLQLDKEVGWYVMVNSHKDPATPKQEFIAVPTIMDQVSAANKAAEFANLTLSSEEVAFPEEVVEEAPAATTDTSANTADITVVVAALSALVSAGIVASKKRH